MVFIIVINLMKFFSGIFLFMFISKVFMNHYYWYATNNIS